jgi:hypothetical protein
LKLPQLLSQYLYQNKKMDLPGIGSFTLDADAVIPQESDRMGQQPATGIHFRNANIPIADDKLVDFIKEHTGKMKSLAASDLDFFLTTGRQLLNIGKPFYLEGIGTLIKNKEGFLEFSHGDYLLTRLEDGSPERRANYEEPARDREPQGHSTKQGMLLALIVVGLVVIGWGGYYLYKRNNYPEPAEKRAVVVADTVSPADSTHSTVKAPDTSGRQGNAAIKENPAAEGTTAAPPAKTTVPVATPPVAASQGPAAPGAILYRFVILSTDNKHHALRRYEQLQGYQLNIKMDQKDSSWFKLYFPISALPRDTSYIKDSLADTYAAPHVIIER